MKVTTAWESSGPALAFRTVLGRTCTLCSTCMSLSSLLGLWQLWWNSGGFLVCVWTTVTMLNILQQFVRLPVLTPPGVKPHTCFAAVPTQTDKVFWLVFAKCFERLGIGVWNIYSNTFLKVGGRVKNERKIILLSLHHCLNFHFPSSPKRSSLWAWSQRGATWKWGVWGELLSDNAVHLPGVGEGDRLTSPRRISPIRQQPHSYSCHRGSYFSVSWGEGHLDKGQLLPWKDRAVGPVDAAACAVAAWEDGFICKCKYRLSERARD